MNVARKVVQQGYHMRGQLSSGSPVSRKSTDLSLSWNVASHEKPEESLRQRLCPTWSLGKKFLAFRDGVTTEPDSLVSIQDRGLRHESLHAPHATVHHVHGDLPDLGVPMLLAEGLDLLLNDWDLLGHHCSQIS